MVCCRSSSKKEVLEINLYIKEKKRKEKKKTKTNQEPNYTPQGTTK